MGGIVREISKRQECERLGGIVRDKRQECERLGGIVRDKRQECERLGGIVREIRGRNVRGWEG